MKHICGHCGAKVTTPKSEDYKCFKAPLLAIIIGHIKKFVKQLKENDEDR